MKYKNLIELFIIFIISHLISLTMVKDVILIYFDKLNPIIYIFISILVFYYFIKTIINKANIKKFTIIYVIFLIIILFFRNQKEVNIQKELYLLKWIKLIFKNKTVFINIVGNFLIFIPAGFILKVYFKKTVLILLFGLIGLTIIELVQVILQVGVFDVVDILLNFIGILTGIYAGGNVYVKRS